MHSGQAFGNSLSAAGHCSACRGVQADAMTFPWAPELEITGIEDRSDAPSSGARGPFCEARLETALMRSRSVLRCTKWRTRFLAARDPIRL